MIVENEQALNMLKQAGHIVAETLQYMLEQVRPGISTKALDDLGGAYLTAKGARSAPRLTYGFPGNTCISVNNVVAHGIPSSEIILQDGDLVNIDVSAEWNGFWADNGASRLVGTDKHNHQKLLDCSLHTLQGLIARMRSGMRINEVGAYMEKQAKTAGFQVIKNLGGHGLGNALHEEPTDILNYRDPADKRRFRKGSVVAIETFFNTRSTLAIEQPDGFTMLGNKGGFAVQHEVTLVLTDAAPIVITPMLYLDLIK
ncbi:type I methionyl aminopeptidase [Sphingobacterium oryzagri]|uniref:Methionine aminopeptidase n=1 Tax=Sphingobacterium oryzagri TaxID=3025669 RepID=A0ABY7WKP8_9SPHI|nr:type I methionyl aminopeptidase [Sphingobacterium sp. KACC 22765]WDF70159.1 type I methionyl aminopeptidase [Sphingobacterium sp. KACC 22765]